jgi:hypothetical protein
LHEHCLAGCGCSSLTCHFPAPPPSIHCCRDNLPLHPNQTFFDDRRYKTMRSIICKQLLWYTSGMIGRNKNSSPEFSILKLHCMTGCVGMTSPVFSKIVDCICPRLFALINKFFNRQSGFIDQEKKPIISAQALSFWAQLFS